MSALWGSLRGRDEVANHVIVSRTFQAVCAECGWASEEFTGPPDAGLVMSAAEASAAHNNEAHAVAPEGALF